MKKSNGKQPANTSVKIDTFNQSQKSLGPDSRGEHPTISRVGNNPTTESNGLIISGPNGNGTI